MACAAQGPGVVGGGCDRSGSLPVLPVSGRHGPGSTTPGRSFPRSPACFGRRDAPCAERDRSAPATSVCAVRPGRSGATGLRAAACGPWAGVCARRLPGGRQRAGSPCCPAFASISRLTVLVGRPRARPIARSDRPSARRSRICSRSASVSYRGRSCFSRAARPTGAVVTPHIVTVPLCSPHGARRRRSARSGSS